MKLDKLPNEMTTVQEQGCYGCLPEWSDVIDCKQWKGISLVHWCSYQYAENEEKNRYEYVREMILSSPSEIFIVREKTVGRKSLNFLRYLREVTEWSRINWTIYIPENKSDSCRNLLCEAVVIEEKCIFRLVLGRMDKNAI